LTEGWTSNRGQADAPVPRPSPHGAARYRFVRTLGSGRFAEVTCVLRQGPAGFERLVALKRPHRDEPAAIERLLREARVGGLLRHESIVATLDVERDELGWYLVLEYVDGPTLAAVLAGAAARPIPVAAAFDMMAALGAGLRHAHALTDSQRRPLGLVHGDLSPANLLLTRKGQLKIADFGGASSALAPTETLGGLGTPGYCAPEVSRREPLDQRADVFSAGAIGRALFACTPLADDSGLTAVWSRATAPERVDRYPDVDALMAALAALRPVTLEPGLPLSDIAAEWIERLATEPHPDLVEAVPGALPPRPYRGLESFGPESASLFFGRQEDARRIARRIRTSPIAVLTGASGAGKSSVLAAGLPEHLPDLVVLRLRPGPDPSTRLARLLGVPRESLLAPVTSTSPTPTLIVVDQAEELLTLATPDLAVEVTSALVRLADTGTTRVLFSVRVDHLAALCDLEPLRGRAGSAVELLTLPSRQQLADALVKPLEPFGYRFESLAVVDRIVSALVGRPGALALLQFTADRLWDLRDEQQKLLRESDLDTIGGIEGAITTYADRILETLAPAEQQVAQHILVRCLQGGARHPLAVPALLAADWAGPRAIEVLERLVSSRLLTRRADPEEGAVVEPAHEALVAHWQRLARWVTEDALAHQLLSELIRAADRWERRGRPPDLLWVGSLLSQWLLFEEELAEHLGPNERHFAEASFAQHRRRRRVRLGIAVAIFAALLAFALLATWAWWQADGAQREAERARHASEIDALLSRAAQHRERGETGEAIELVRSVLEAEPGSAQAIAELYAAVGGRAESIILTGHRDTVRDAAFTPDGERVVTVAMDEKVRIWDRDGHLLHTVDPGLGPIYRVRVSPAGDRLTAVGATGLGKIYGLDGAPIATLDIGEQPALAAWDRSGKRLIVTGARGKAFVYDAAGTRLSELTTAASGLGWGAFSPDGSKILYVSTGDVDGKVFAADGDVLASFTSRPDTVLAEFSPALDSGRFITASWPGFVQLFDAEGKELAHIAARGRYPAAAWSLDGGRFVAGAPDDEGALVVVTADGHTLHTLSGHRAPIHVAAYGPDGLVASGDERGEVRLFAPSGETIAVFVGHAGRVWSLAFSSDGTRLLSASEDGTARIWDTQGRSRARLMTGRFVEQCPIDASGERILTLTGDHVERWTEVRIFDTRGTELVLLKDTSDDMVDEVAWRPDGNVAVALQKRGAMRWLGRDGRDLGRLTPKSPVRVIAWRGDTLFGGTEDGHVTVLTPEGEGASVRVFGQPVKRLAVSARLGAASSSEGLAVFDLSGIATPIDPRDGVRALCWSPDGTRLAVGREDASAEIRDATGRLIATLPGHRERVVQCAWHPDSQRVATAAWDGDARIWGRDGALLEVVGGHRREVQTAEWSPDGARFLTTEWSGVAVLRDARGVLARLSGHGGEVVRATFARDLPLIATCARNGREVRLWPADDDTLQRWADALVPKARPWRD